MFSADLNSPTPTTVLPWDRPGILGFVLGKQPLVQLVPPIAVQQPPPPLSSDEYRSLGALGSSTDAAAVPDVSLPALKRQRFLQAPATDVTRQRLLERWFEAVSMNVQCSKVGRQLAAEPSEQDQRESLRLSLASRSNSTLATHLTSTSQYVRWARLHRLVDPWPPSEPQAYAFLKAFACKASPLTRATNFMKMMKFWKYVLGTDGLSEVVDSQRLDGLALERLSALVAL